jgi:hypothetical protein
VGAHEGETDFGLALGWGHDDRTNVAEAGFRTGAFPELVDGYEGVGHGRYESHALKEQPMGFIVAVHGHDRHVSYACAAERFPVDSGDLV